MLAVWTTNKRVEFYDIETGARYGDSEIPPMPPYQDYTGEMWQIFLENLKDMKARSYLPMVITDIATIYTTTDGMLRLVYEAKRHLHLLADGHLTRLDTQSADYFISLDFDPISGCTVALDAGGRLYIYQRAELMGVFELGLDIDMFLYPSVIIANNGGTIFVTDGKQIVALDASGDVLRRIPIHYNLRHMACSPDGARVVTSDTEAGLIRVYNGHDLKQTHQRFAVDLIADAQQVQLLANLPPITATVSALVAGDNGVIGFAMSGVICMTDVSYLTALPQA